MDGGRTDVESPSILIDDGEEAAAAFYSYGTTVRRLSVVLS